MPPYAGVVELADARDSKSRVRKDVRVRPPPPAPKNQHLRQEVLVFAYLKRSDGQTQLVPARLYGFLAFVYGLVRMALTSVIFSPSVNVTALPSWVSR